VQHMIPQQPRRSTHRKISSTDPGLDAGTWVTVDEAEDGFASLQFGKMPAGFLFLDRVARRELAAALVVGLT
jgi:hypothetical protein